MKAPPTTISELCIRCGLCCSGVLFADVLLKKNDTTTALEGAELPLEDREGGTYLLQPCAALCRGRCQVYEQRPTDCRKFNCAVVKKVKRGKLTLEEGAQLVRRAKDRIRRLEKLLSDLGNRQTDLPLTWRYDETFSQPWDPNVDEVLNIKRSRLLKTSTSLAQFLDNEFLRG
ncbi:YkgJ family cysteine cluster protein [bacterium]|nr:YkgJ family cysteine cluster protein [bacterium]